MCGAGSARRKDARPGQPRGGEQGAAPLAAFSPPLRTENFVAKGFGSGGTCFEVQSCLFFPPCACLRVCGTAQ